MGKKKSKKNKHQTQQPKPVGAAPNRNPSPPPAPPSNPVAVVEPPGPQPVAIRPQTRIQPEEMSLLAHHHIQQYLGSLNRETLEKDDVTAVLRLSQHLRLFGLLSATGYVNQTNQQNGKVAAKTARVWAALLGQFIDSDAPLERRELMTRVQALAQNEPQRYMNQWRKVLRLSKHWNFWARAYGEGEG